MSYSVSTGFSGAASGAATGASVGSVVPGVGTAVGAGVGAIGGALTGFFGGDDDENGPRQQAIGQNRELLSMLEDRFQAAEDRTPTETTFFESGMAQAREQADRAADRDAAQAAARGLEGSQFALAQDAQRQRQFATTQQELLGQASQLERQDERAALQRLLQQRSQLNSLVGSEASAQRRADQRRSASVQRALSQLGQSALSTFGQSGGGGSSGG